MLFLAVLLASILSAPAAGGDSLAKTRYAKIGQVCPAPALGYSTCFALVRVPLTAATSAAAGVAPYVVNDGASSAGPAGGLTPAQLAGAYNYEPANGGAGQTVAIVDAYNDPDIEGDLATFDSEYGLPPCTRANDCLRKVGETGRETSLPEADASGWSVEMSLDVETVHSVCQSCKILLVEANEPSNVDLADAVNEAVALGATEVSNSYGGPEEGILASEAAAYNHPGVVITAAAGDDGYDDWDYIENKDKAFAMPNSPASLPSVVAVGGTSLVLNTNGTRATEKVWNDDGPADELGFPKGFVAGGGCSTLFTAQPWQLSTPGYATSGCGTGRLAADVSAVADPYTGFDIYDSYDCGAACETYGIGKGKDWMTLGGTSLTTPLISALYALAGGSGGVPYPALSLYGHLSEGASLYDVTEGGNGFCDAEPLAECGEPNLIYGRVDCEGATSCDAAPGYDGPSGVGTPNGLDAFKPLLPKAVITAPSVLTEDFGASFNAQESSDPYPGGSVAAYSWSWGDGTADSSTLAPTHAYASPGSYSVTLTVTDSYGLLSAPATQVVNVTGPTSGEELLKRAQEEEAATEATRKQQEQQSEANLAKLGSILQEVASFHVGAAAAAVVPDARLASTALVVSLSGVVTIKVICSRGHGACQGKVTLRTLAAAVQHGVARAPSTATVLTLASGGFSVAAGQVKTVKLHISPRARTLLARSHVVHIRATIIVHNDAGAPHTTMTLATLRAARGH
ncbi:MAG TPA: PKD domain-containing protein [Solirubrobacteraceae bacterium]|jgi:hypothetical protein|nr:PKD domain-containing protein [Solirubrobacteraceae bacterium]